MKNPSNKWSREVCRQYFIEHYDSNIKDLAIKSGNSRTILNRWALEENWIFLKHEYQERILALGKNTLAKLSTNKVFDKLADIAFENYHAHKQIRDASLGKFLEKINSDISASELNYWSMIVARATQNISLNTGLSTYLNHNAAFKLIDQLGFDVIEKNSDS